ncbi:MAG: hypothetical protein JST00_46795 [Deltaproteobacteria bacterium]|nr:hypothetical protein [Deltaproteobacteria bacterium]
MSRKKAKAKDTNQIRKRARKPMPHVQSDDQMRAHLSKQLHDETDRGCALVGGAMVDEALGQLIQECMIVGKAPKNFGERLRLAQSFGFISENEHADIDDIREIRNGAAHVLGTPDEPWEFKDTENRARCYRLRTFNIAGATARVRFTGAVVFLTVTLQERATLARNLQLLHSHAEALASVLDHARADPLMKSEVPETALEPSDFVKE